MKHEDAEAAIRMVHEAALRPETWPDALHRLALSFGATGSVAQMVGRNGYLILSSRGYEGCVEDYIEGGWQQLNTRITRGLALTKAGFSGFVTEYHMFGAEELARDPFQQEFAPRHGMEAEAGIVAASHEGSAFVLTTPRSARVGPYTASELESMNRLMELFASACSFALQLKLATAATMLDSLAASGGALALLAPTGRILHMTASFERLLHDRLTTLDGCLHARHPQDDRELQTLILRCGSWLSSFDEPLSPILLRSASGAPLVARCMPVAGSARDFLGLARIVISVDELVPAAADTGQALRAAFNLTPAEVRLAGRIGQGASLREAAEAEGVTFETARTRLKSVFAKTDTSRQAELALLVARIAWR
jgi:DNA-binding CsgD family transcriptional regulator